MNRLDTYLEAQRALLKVASIDPEPPKEEKPQSVAGIIGKGLLGLGLGMGAGYGVGRGLQWATGGKIHGALPVISTIAGAGAGAGYPIWKAYEAYQIHKALEDKAKREEQNRIAMSQPK